MLDTCMVEIQTCYETSKGFIFAFWYHELCCIKVKKAILEVFAHKSVLAYQVKFSQIYFKKGQFFYHSVNKQPIPILILSSLQKLLESNV